MVEACENAKADCMTLADIFTHINLWKIMNNYIIRKPTIFAVNHYNITVTLTCIFQCGGGRLTPSNDHNLFYPRESGKLGVWGQISEETKIQKHIDEGPNAKKQHGNAVGHLYF